MWGGVLLVQAQKKENALPRWYIAQTKPACEAFVEMRWKQVGYEVFYPRILKRVRRAEKYFEKSSSLFPSYLFVRLDLNDPTHHRNVLYTRGVRKLLGVDSVPVPVHDRIVELLQEHVNEKGLFATAEKLSKGSKIRVIHGPLKDLVGVLEKPASADGRIKVLIEAYHKTIRAELWDAEIEHL